MERLKDINIRPDYIFYIGLSLVTAVPIYFFLNFYVGALGFYSADIIKANQDKVSISLTLIFLLLVFAGRYLSLVHVARNKKI